MPSFAMQSCRFFEAVNVAFVLILVTSFSDVIHSSSPVIDNSVNKQKIDANLLTQKIGANRTIIVDASGQGNFTSVQAAIDSVPNENAEWVIVHVRKGVYRERVHIPLNKPNIFMRGNGHGKTAIVSSQSSTNNYNSATLVVESPNFIAFGISFKNDAPTGVAQTSQNQSVAAIAGADKIAFYHCAFYSTHNTLFDYKGRHYYDSCYIQGSIDIVFGRGQSMFHSCEVFVIMDRRHEVQGSITAHTRQSTKENTGFVFINGKVYGARNLYLGRPNGPFSRVVYANTYLSGAISPQGWTNWSHVGSTENLYQAEYKCRGPGSMTKDRAPWSKQLSDEEVAPFLTIDFIDGKQWLPAWL